MTSQYETAHANAISKWTSRSLSFLSRGARHSKSIKWCPKLAFKFPNDLIHKNRFQFPNGSPVETLIASFPNPKMWKRHIPYQKRWKCHMSQGQVPAEGVDPDSGSSGGSCGAGLSVGIASWRSNKSHAVWKRRTASVTMLNGSRCNSVSKKSRIQSLRITREAIANRRSLACSRHPGRNNADNFRATGGVSICKGVSALCSGHQRCSKRNNELLVICHIL